MDLSILHYLQGIHHPILDFFMIIFTHLGDGGIIWILLSFFFLVKKETRVLGLTMVLGLIFCLLFGNLLIKNIVARPRPFHIHFDIPLIIKEPSGYSFPSGHTLASFTSVTILYFYNKKWGKWAFLLALIIGFSRMYHFVHYPTDVLAGMVLGYLLGRLSIKGIDYFLIKRGG
ncbi:MAG: phosphatase PAP2 family protein [Tissierellia bacterium]|nr:phosphatase PAP2 family protein [Tissierellia bacterium]